MLSLMIMSYLPCSVDTMHINHFSAYLLIAKLSKGKVKDSLLSPKLGYDIFCNNSVHGLKASNAGKRWRTCMLKSNYRHTCICINGKATFKTACHDFIEVFPYLLPTYTAGEKTTNAPKVKL